MNREMWYYVHHGQQAGPVSQNDLHGFLLSRSLPVMTLVWREGMAEWIPATDVPELMAGVPGGGGVPHAGYVMAGMHPPVTNSMALMSMVLGLLGLVVAGIFSAIPAIICGHIARRQIREAGGAQTGSGMALTGLITGYLVTLLTAIAIVAIIIFLVYIFNMGAGSSPTVPGSGSSPSLPGSGTPAPFRPTP